jgi:phosphohistidine phosphatase
MKGNEYSDTIRLKVHIFREPMKTVYFVRHAKSSWEDMSLADQDRPLNKRGKRDASHMARVMAEQEEKPDVIISSPAVRAVKTSNQFRKAFRLKKSKYILEPRVYHGMPLGIMEVLMELAQDVSVVYIFGHNPGFTELVNHFSEEEIVNVPTTGICKVRFDITDWKQVTLENGKLEGFFYPKQYFH